MANNDLVGSVVKAMALVKITAAAPDGLKICELAEAANLKNVTCFNLVRTLIAGGFLDKINGRVYVGSEITRLAGNRFHPRPRPWSEFNFCWPRALGSPGEGHPSPGVGLAGCACLRARWLVSSWGSGTTRGSPYWGGAGLITLTWSLSSFDYASESTQTHGRT